MSRNKYGSHMSYTSTWRLKEVSTKKFSLIQRKPPDMQRRQHCAAVCIGDGSFVSTDDNEIASNARIAGASILGQRPSNLAGDEATIDEVAAHFLRTFFDNQSLEKIDCVVLLQPTAPLTLPSHIDECVEMMKKNRDLDSVTTLCQLDNRHHPFNIGKQTSENTWDFIDPQQRSLHKTRQSKPVRYKFGNLFVTRPATLLLADRFGSQKGFLPIDPTFSVDIDEYSDLIVAEALFDHLQRNT